MRSARCVFLCLLELIWEVVGPTVVLYIIAQQFRDASRYFWRQKGPPDGWILDPTNFSRRPGHFHEPLFFCLSVDIITTMATNKNASFTATATTTPEKPTTSSFSTASSPDLSPNAIVKAAAADAMMQEQNKTKDASTDDDDTTTNTSTKRRLQEDDDRLQQLDEIWKKQKENNDPKEQAIQETWKLISNSVDEVIQNGIHAYQEWERAQQQLKVVQEDCSAKSREIERLKASEQKSRESIGVSLHNERGAIFVP